MAKLYLREMVFVTGATGLVGSYLLVELSRRGEKIRAMKRKHSSVESVKQLFQEFDMSDAFEQIEWMDADLLDVTIWSELLKEVKTIYHAAAVVSFDKKSKNQLHEVNVIGTKNLVNAAIAENVPELVFFGSIATLDRGPNEAVIDEKSNWNPEIKHSPYAISKRKAEMEVWRGSQEGLKVLVVYPSVIIGSLDGKRESERIFRWANKKKMWGTLGETGYIDVRDVAYCTAELVKLGKWSEGFLLNAAHLSYLEVLQIVRRNWGLSPAQSLTNGQLKWIQKLSSIGQFLGMPHLSRANYEALTGKTVYTTEKLEQYLPHTFYTIEEALAFHGERFQQMKQNNN